MKISHPIIKLVIVIAVVCGATIYFYRDRFACDLKSGFQQGLCRMLGGELRAISRSGEFVNWARTACVPTKKAVYAGKPCFSDRECEGYCLHESPTFSSGPMGRCSDYRKSIPVCAAKGSP